MGLENDQDINVTEAYELLQHTERKKKPPSKNPFKWVADRISERLNLLPPDDSLDSDSVSDDESTAAPTTLKL